MLFHDEAIILIYFFYGLAFYSLGLALLVESGRSSQLDMSRSFRLLAAFGLLHGAHEWVDMLERGIHLYANEDIAPGLRWLHVVLLVASFLALLAFGERLLRQQQPPRHWLLTLGGIIWYSLSAILIKIIYKLDDTAWLVASDVLARYVLGIPGAMLTALALWRQRASFRVQHMDYFLPALTVAAITIGIYGVPGQLFPRESVVFPSNLINDVYFLEKFGFPVQFFRAGIATVMAVAMIRVLRALDFENQQQLLAIEQEKVRTEQLSRAELNLLNEELVRANAATHRLLLEVQQRDARRGELLQRITSAQEAERQRIARELHDETGQALTGLAMGLQGISGNLPKDQPVARQVALLQEMATSAVGQLRHLINDLRPPQLDDMGLVAALRWLAKMLQERSHLPITFAVRGDPIPIPPHIETALFRIAQESLNNVIKHAHASDAKISLNFNGGLTLTIQDNGVGFDAAAALSQVGTSWGIVGIQERAHLIHAAFDLQSHSGEGTCLTIHVEVDPTSTTDNPLQPPPLAGEAGRGSVFPPFL